MWRRIFYMCCCLSLCRLSLLVAFTSRVGRWIFAPKSLSRLRRFCHVRQCFSSSFRPLRRLEPPSSRNLRCLLTYFASLFEVPGNVLDFPEGAGTRKRA